MYSSLQSNHYQEGLAMKFDDYIREADDMLSRRELEKAQNTYSMALLNAVNHHNRMQALQMMGITYRLVGKYDNARQAFDLAVFYAQANRVAIARINRDIGMVDLDEATRSGVNLRLVGHAEVLFVASRNELLELGEPVEAAASNGFYGRALFIKGERRLAISALRRAHDGLAGKNDTYELNNLVWLARASQASRFIHTHRAWKLARRTKHPMRWKEYVVILVGGEPLYRLIEKKYGA